MHTGTISFCDQSGLNIKSHETKAAIVKILESKYRVRIIQRHHDRLDRPAQLHKLQANPHLVCLRSNGNPYYMFMTRYQYTNQCIFIDKKVQGGYDLPRMIISNLRFADDLFEDDTLMEGEMVRDANGNWFYLIHDIMVHKGRYLENEPLVKRLNLVYDILGKSFRPDDLDVCCVQVKKYVPYDRIHELVYEIMPKLPYTCRGLYFKSLYLRFLDVLFNFDESLIVKVERIKYQKGDVFNMNAEEVLPLAVHRVEVPPPAAPVPAQQAVESPKAKAKGERTLLIEKTHNVDVYNLYEPTTKKPAGLACVVHASTSRMLQDVFAPVNPTTRFLVKCTYHDRFQKWVPQQLVNG